MGLLNFTGVSKSYNQRMLFQGITFSVERGERVALTGPNGTGKTTLVRIAMGLETPDSGMAVIARGTKAGFLTQDLSQLEKDSHAMDYSEVARLEGKIREIERELEHASKDSLTELMKKYSRLTQRYEAIDGYTVESRLKATLLGLGLRQEALFTPILQLSSGERMRAALARILLEQPDLLVLDEPTNHLDIQAIEWLENFLLKFFGGVMMISHDRYFLDKTVTRVIELNNGSIVEHKGNYSSFLTQKGIKQDYTTLQKRRINQQIKQTQQLVRDLREKARIRAAQSHEKGIEKLKQELSALYTDERTSHLGKINATRLSLNSARHISAEIALAKNARKVIDGNRVLFENVSFLIRGGERVGIIGPNGCGKTTLLRILLQTEKGYTGVCKIGEWVKVGLLDQNAEFPDETRTVFEEVMLKMQQMSVQSSDAMFNEKVRDALSRVGFYGNAVDKSIKVLSGGERVRLKLCCLLQEQPHCLVLDEPTNHLDLPAREAVEKAIANFNGSIIAVSHDRFFLSRCVNRILAFEGTRIRAYSGNWEAYKEAKERVQAQPAAIKKRPIPQRKVQVPQKTPTFSQPMKKNNKAEISRIESEISILETEKRNLELSFGPDADPDIYRRHTEIGKSVDKLYAEWDQLESGL